MREDEGDERRWAEMRERSWEMRRDVGDEARSWEIAPRGNEAVEAARGAKGAEREKHL